jgi:flagellar hook-length control protein FliK
VESSANNNQTIDTQSLNNITKADNLVSRPGEQNVEFNNQTTGNLTTNTAAKSVNSNTPTPDMGKANEMMTNIDNIAEQIRSRLQLAPGSSRMVIDLKPESLGKIKIDLNYEKNKVEAIFRVDNTEVKALLDAELPKLKSEMKLDSYRVEMNTNDLHHDLHAQHGRRGFRDFDDSPKPGKNTVNKNDNINTIAVDNKPKTNRSVYSRGGAVDLLV